MKGFTRRWSGSIAGPAPAGLRRGRPLSRAVVHACRRQTRAIRVALGVGLMGFSAAAGTELGAQIALTGDPQTLVVYSAVAGFAPDPTTDDMTTYSVELVESSDIEVRLDAPLPAGVMLYVRMEPPPGASSAGLVPLSTTPQVLVGSIPPGTYSSLSITYELWATVTAGVVPLDSRQVSFSVRTAS